jgi:hypothetical protein
VDDDLDIANLYKLSLERDGFAVDTFNDPLLALSILININSLSIIPKQIFGYVKFETLCSIIIGYRAF